MRARSRRPPRGASLPRRPASAARALWRRTRDWLTYDLPSELMGIAWRGRYRGQKQMWFAARFEGEESEIDIGPREGHEQEFDAWRWVTLKELPALVVPFKRKVYSERDRGVQADPQARLRAQARARLVVWARSFLSRRIKRR